MFDGAFKTTRKVNMSGRRTPYATSSSSSSAMSAGATSKEQILAQARLAREERQVQKRRTAASTTIQALHRRVAAATQARTAAFSALERELTQLVATVDIKTTPQPMHSLTLYLRQFWFAFGRDVLANVGISDAQLPPPSLWRGLANVTRARVQNVQTYLVVMLLVSCLRGTTPDTNYLAAAKDTTWVYQVTRLLEVALRTLTTTQFANAHEKAASPYVLLVDTFVRADTPAALHTTLALHVQYGPFEALGDVIREHTLARTRAQDIAADRVVQVVSASVVAALQLEEQRVTRAFARTMLLTPGSVASTVGRFVIAQLKPEGNEREKMHASAAFWQRALVTAATSQTTLTWSERAAALGNTLALLQLHAFERALVAAASALLPQLLVDSVVQWAFETDSNDASDIEMVDETATNVAVSTAATADARAGVEQLGAFAPTVREQIAQLSDATFNRRWLDAVTAINDDDGAVETDNDVALAGFCATYAALLLGADRSYVLSVTSSFAPPARPVFAFLSGVVVDYESAASTLDRVWLRLERALQLAQRQLSTATTGVVTYTRTQLEMLVVFNAVFSHVLLGLDDETFYDRAWPLPLAHVANVVASLKTFIYDTCWTAASPSTSSRSSSSASSAVDTMLFAAVTTSVKLFNQLYDRDCRRRFTADGAWLWPAMPAIKEIVDLESMEDDDDVDMADNNATASSGNTHALRALLSGTGANSPHTRAALVLATLPQVFAFTDRVLLFEKLLDADKAQLTTLRNEFAGALTVRIKRDAIVDESIAFFQRVTATQTASVLKARIKVTFVNAQGLEEAGIDGGGVFKEYIDALTKHAFAPDAGAFLATSEQLLYPNPAAAAQGLDDRFEFLGLVLAKAVYENILVEPQFAAFFLNKLLGKLNYIDDLASLDPALYRHVMQLKHLAADDVDDLALTFSVAEPAPDGSMQMRDLIPNGSNVAVTNANRIRYIHVLANYKLNVQSSRTSAAFLRGFRSLVPAKWIQMFAPAELQMLLGGSANTIDVDDWARHTTYGGGYHASQQPIQWFWDIVRYDFDAVDRAALLKFITSCSRQPLLGFAQLAPQICVHQVRTSDDERLPSSATCMNLLKLPTYSSRDIMRRKLLYAIRANAGFDLS